jgi:hypothetical protein
MGDQPLNSGEMRAFFECDGKSAWEELSHFQWSGGNRVIFVAQKR